MKRIALVFVGSVLLAGGPWVLRGDAARSPAAGQVRHYYVQAENVEWTIVPSGYEDDKLGRRVAARETRFTAIVLRGYEDPEFTHPSPQPP